MSKTPLTPAPPRTLSWGPGLVLILISVPVRSIGTGIVPEISLLAVLRGSRTLRCGLVLWSPRRSSFGGNSVNIGFVPSF